MTTKTEQQLVPLADLAGRLTTTGEEAHRLAELQGGKVVADWSGRPSVPADVAQRVVDAYEARRLDDLAARRNYNHYERTWHQKRAEVGQAAYQKTLDEQRPGTISALLKDGRTSITGPLPPDGQSLRAAYEARADALARHDEKTPLLDFGTWQRRKANR